MPVEGPVDDPQDRNGYTDREMRLIFERAGQLDVESGSERRFSLAELREMGAQAGLDPADISTAAASTRFTILCPTFNPAPPCISIGS